MHHQTAQQKGPAAANDQAPHQTQPGILPTLAALVATAGPVPHNLHRWPLTPRQRRLLRALLAGPVTREEVDSIAGCSNGPDVVFQMRQRFGLAVPCEMRHGRDRDNQAVQFGVYSLAPADRQTVVELLKAAHAH